MDTEKAKKIIEEVFSLINIPTESVSYSLDEKRGHIFSIKSDEFEKVSKEKLDLAKDMVYLLKRMFNKESKFGEEMFKCTIDINNAQSKSDEIIKTKALAAAEQARNLKTDVEMEPMSSYERMVVHSTLAGLPDINTESVGVGKERKLKVKYLSI